jgi:hypothetical protein
MSQHAREEPAPAARCRGRRTQQAVVEPGALVIQVCTSSPYRREHGRTYRALLVLLPVVAVWTDEGDSTPRCLTPI